MKQVITFVVVATLAAGCKKTAAPATNVAPGGAAPATAAAPNGAAPAATPAPPKPMPAQIPPVLARVNGEAIEKWEFDNAVKSMEARAGGPVPADRRDEVLRGVLDQLVAYHLLAQESHALKLDVPDKDVDAQVAQIRQGFPSEDAFKKGLSAQGMTLDQLKTQTRTRMQVAKVIETEVSSKVSVQDADVDAFYKQNVDRFKQDESVHASHILFGVPQNATPEQKAQARAAAQETLKQLKGGADFATLARERSQDSSAQNGGDLGFVPKGQTVPAFEEAAFKLKPGAMSGIVETPFGFHIIKVHERRPARTAPLAEVSGQIKQFLEQGQREQKLEQFIEQTKSRAKIEMLV